MKIKENVLKEYNELGDVTFEKLGNENKLNDFLIDLTLTEVSKVIDVKIKVLEKMYEGYDNLSDRMHMRLYIDGLKSIKQKLGIK